MKGKGKNYGSKDIAKGLGFRDRNRIYGDEFDRAMSGDKIDTPWILTKMLAFTMQLLIVKDSNAYDAVEVLSDFLHWDKTAKYHGNMMKAEKEMERNLKLVEKGINPLSIPQSSLNSDEAKSEVRAQIVHKYYRKKFRELIGVTVDAGMRPEGSMIEIIE